jgi:hypothetical protein
MITQIASKHKLVVARVAAEPKKIDLKNLIKRKKPFKIGNYSFDKFGTLIFEHYRYGISIDGWGDVSRPCLVICDRKLSDATPPNLDKHSIEYNETELESKLIKDIDHIFAVVKKIDSRAANED